MTGEVAVTRSGETTFDRKPAGPAGWEPLGRAGECFKFTLRYVDTTDYDDRV